MVGSNEVNWLLSTLQAAAPEAVDNRVCEETSVKGVTLSPVVRHFFTNNTVWKAEWLSAACIQLQSACHAGLVPSNTGSIHSAAEQLLCKTRTQQH
jgi:hypothetical protein